MVILGLDPGLASTGFGAVRLESGKTSAVRCGHIKTSPKDTLSSRLTYLHSDIRSIVATVNPDLVALENVFSLVRYPKAGILLGTVLGAIYLALSERNISAVEISPKEVKNALAGYGSASKQQVRATVQKILDIPDPGSYHAADALAVALTALYRHRRLKQ